MELIGVAAAFVVLFIVSNWWTEGLINGGEMVLLTVIFGGLSVGVFVTDGWVPRLLVLSLLLGSVGWMVHQHIKGGSRRYYRDRIKTYENVIRADPRNTAARSGLASAYYQLGDLDNAIAAMELAIEQSTSHIRESHLIRQWQYERELRDSKNIVCQHCHARNVWGESLCSVCRQPLSYPKKGGVSAAGLELKYAVIGVLWVVLTCVAFAVAPPGQAVVVVLCGTIASAGWGLLASKSK